MVVEIVAKNNEAIAKMRETSVEANKMAAEASAAGEKSGAAWQKMQGVGKAAFLALAGTAAVVGVESVKMAAEFQESTNKLAGSAQITTDAANNIGKAFLSTAGTSTFSAQQMVDAYGPVARQLETVEGHALSSGDALKVMKASSDLAEASGGDLADTTKTLSTVMQAYHISVADAAETSNTLFNASTLLNTPIADIATAVDKLHGKLGIAAPSLGDTAALMVDLGEHGITGSKGLMAVNGAMTTLLGGSQATKDELKTLGVDVYDSSGKFIGMQEAISKLSPALAGMSDQQKKAAETALFGAGAAGAMNGVMSGGAEAFETASKAVEKHGAVESAAERNASSFQGQLKMVFATAKDLGVMIGTALLPPLQDALKGFMGFFNYLKDNQGVAIGLGVAVGVLVGGLASLYVITKTVQVAQAAWALGTKLVAGAQWLLNAALDANPIGIVILAIGALVAGFVIAYNNIGWFKDGVNAAFSFIQTIIGDVVNFVGQHWQLLLGILTGPIGLAVLFVVTHWTQISDVFKLVWSNITTSTMTTWNNITNFIGSAWNWIKNLVIAPWKLEFQLLGAAGTWLWKNAIAPAFQGIQNVASAGWSWIDNNVFTPFKIGINAIGLAFDATQKFIGAAWNKIKDAAASPVRWIVDTVYTNGIEKVWNNIAGAVGLDLKLPNVSAGFADGGIYGTRPGYTPGRDTHLIAVSGGEAIMRPEWARAVGSDGVDRMNGLAKSGGVGAIRKAMGYADGGVVGYADGGIAGIIGGIGSAIGSVVSSVGNFLADPIGSITSMITGPVKAMQHLAPGGKFGQMAFQLPINVVDGLGAKAKQLVGAMAPPPAATGSGNTGSGGGGGSVGGTGQWSSMVLTALAMMGQPASLLNTTLRRMNQESGGNANAINNWDSNAAAGIPSKGLMQVIDPTFRAYAMPGYNSNIYDPMSNILASMHYAISRYGSLAGAYNQAGGYASGGVVPVFDQGGWVPPGVSMINNKTGAPERLSNTTHGGGQNITNNVSVTTNATGPQIAGAIGWALKTQF